MAYSPYNDGTGPSTSGGPMLEELPPSPPARIKPRMPAPQLPPSLSMPGDDTMSLLGAPNVNGEGVGVSMQTPTGRALAGVMKMMEGANDIQSVIPGVIPPPLIMMIQALTTQIPEIVRNMQQMTGPGGMLSTMGANDLGGGGGLGGNPMNPMSPMGMGGGAGMPMPMPMAGAPEDELSPMGEGRRRPPMLGM